MLRSIIKRKLFIVILNIAFLLGNTGFPFLINNANAQNLPKIDLNNQNPTEREETEVATNNSSNQEDEIDAEWLEQAKEKIANQEYYAALQTKDTKGNDFAHPRWHFANRAQNLRAYMDYQGWEMMPRSYSTSTPQEEQEWNLKYQALSLGREKAVSSKQSLVNDQKANITTQENLITVQRATSVEEWYKNSPQGLEHGFNIKQKPEGDGSLVLTGKYQTDLKIEQKDNQLIFKKNDQILFVYDKLYVFDTNNQTLPAKFKLTQTQNNYYLEIIIDDTKAVYPLTIDPIYQFPSWTAESDQASAYFGYSVSSAGDVNGDGYDDVIVGAYYYDNGQLDEGRAFVYHGSASGLSTTANWTAESDQGSAKFGISVSSAGDVNNDGYDDVIVGAYHYSNGQLDEGRAFVYHGSASGLSASANWTAESDQASTDFGYSVSSAGDVNGDGYDDVIVGANYYDNGQTDEGRAFVYHGSASGLSTTANWTAESDQASAYFGVSVSSAGDVNNDGYDDVIVSAYCYDNGQTDEGRAFVYHGSASGLSTTANWTAESDQGSARFGISVSSAGDVNGDGYDDVIVGAYYYDNSQSDEGRAFVYHGSASGLSASANWTAESDQASASFGYSVSSAGDVNNDGYDDVIIGASSYDNGQSNEGRAFVYYGASILNTYTISYNANSADSGTVPASQTKTQGVDLTLRTNTGSLAKTGYTFSGWNTAADGSGTHYAEGGTFTTDANTTLYAEWTANTYQVAFDGNGADSGSMSNQNFTYDVAQNLTANAYTKTGYVFSDWNTQADGSGTGYTDGQSVSNLTAINGATVTLYAQWADDQNPVISNVSVSPNMSQTTIEWNTNEESSSQVEYGLTGDYGSNTPETNTSPRVTQHTVTLSDLKSCAKYYFRVKSKDEANNQGVSSQDVFYTTGCEVSSISSGNSGSIEVSGGTVSLNTNKGTASITAPNNFASETTTIQINKLNSSTVSNAPSGTNLVDDNCFKLLAVSSNGNTVVTFDQPVTFVVSYGSEVESSYKEETLDVYKYESGSWTKKNCALDTQANTLTCALANFSVYGVFGEVVSASNEKDEENENDVYPPVVAIGKKKVFNLSENESVSVRKRNFVLRGKVLDLEEGTVVEIEKDGKVIAERKISAKKKWRFVARNKSNEASFRFRYLEKSSREEIRSSGTYRILIDKKDPVFVSFAKSTSAAGGETITWQTTDNDQIKYFKIRFQGKNYSSAESRFQIPQDAGKGVAKLVVSAFDRAGNKAAKKMMVKIR